MADLVGEDRVVLEAGPHRADLADDQARRARGRDGRGRDELRAERPAEQPDDAERCDARERPAAMAGGDPGQAKHCQGREDEHRDAEHRRTDDEQVRLRPPDRVAQRLDADPGVAAVGDRVERPVEGLEEPHVEGLHDDHQTEDRSDDAGQEEPTPGRKNDGQGDEDEALERDPHERVGRETVQLVRHDEGEPHDDKGEDREHDGDACAHPSASRAGASVGCRSGTGRGVPVAPQPPDIAAERLGEQGERGGDGELGQSPRHDVCRRDRQHDPLRRGDDLAPVARRQRLAHPRQQPPGYEEHVAREADREHPGAERAGDVHAEDEDQERIDLGVEVGTQRRRRPGAPDDPAVDPVQHERDGREGHQQRDLRGVLERVRDQGRDAHGERGASEGHPVGRAQPIAPEVGDGERQCRVHDDRAGDSDDPTRDAEPDRPRERRRAAAPG